MRSRLDPSSRALAAQDLLYAAQHDGELFLISFVTLNSCSNWLTAGTVCQKTQVTLLHSQLQERLRYDIMKAAAVSGSHGY